MKIKIPKWALVVITVILLFMKVDPLGSQNSEPELGTSQSQGQSQSSENEAGSTSSPALYSVETDQNIGQGLPECKFIVIDCGQADSILLTSNDFNILFDAGESRDAKEIRETLDNLNISKLDYVIATHAHADHIGGMQTIVENYSIDKIIMSPMPHTSRTYEKLLSAISERNISVDRAEPNKEYTIGDLKLTIIGPCDTYNNDLNNSSVVAIASYGNIDILLTGDAEEVSEKDFIKNLGEYNNKIEILKSGHHGSDTSSSDELLDNINASVALISCGVDNKYGHPCQGTLNKYSERGMEVYRTDIQGSITVTTDGNYFEVDTEK